MIYIIGGRGYVGSGFARYCRTRRLPHQVITRENYDEFAGTSCDVLVNANGNSRKFLADREPVAEFDHRPDGAGVLPSLKFCDPIGVHAPTIPRQRRLRP